MMYTKSLILTTIRAGRSFRPVLSTTTTLLELSRPPNAPLQNITSPRHFTRSSNPKQAQRPLKPEQILPQQRLRRPISPHLGIYRLNINYFLSPSNRIAAIILTAPFYVFGSAYLVSPLFGWNLSAGSVAAAFGALPLLAKIGIKFFFALPFTMHCLNGVRHLMWDTARGLTNAQTQRSGWIVAGLSVAGAVALALT
ncbi:hypothetical protein MBLNU457_g0360t1 [Dothideomycetes sp. NU457]